MSFVFSLWLISYVFMSYASVFQVYLCPYVFMFHGLECRMCLSCVRRNTITISL